MSILKLIHHYNSLGVRSLDRKNTTRNTKKLDILKLDQKIHFKLNINKKIKLYCTVLNLDQQIIFGPFSVLFDIFSVMISLFSITFLDLDPKQFFFERRICPYMANGWGSEKGLLKFSSGSCFYDPGLGVTSHNGMDNGGRGDSPPWSKNPKN